MDLDTAPSDICPQLREPAIARGLVTCRMQPTPKSRSSLPTSASYRRCSTRSAQSMPNFCAAARVSIRWIRPLQTSTSPRRGPSSPTRSKGILLEARCHPTRREPIMMISKIADRHLSRQACIYIRQSTMGQVRFNQESTERQYNLASKAQSLGWNPEQIRILDRDLGQSGARI